MRDFPFWRKVWYSLAGVPRHPDDRDLEDRVPDDIGITEDAWYWYITARYDFGKDESGYTDHEHVEIKLDRKRLDEFLADLRSHGHIQ